ncbi:MAG: hypothetical protein QG597_1717, partial [Actinomycetota bacterium]|nr:hypothetical protein [Actinomycetota bacterium]
ATLMSLVTGGVLGPSAAAASAGVVIDPAFDPRGGLAGSIEAIAVQADGKVIIGGSFEAVSGVPRASLARLNVDGTLDVAFDPGGGPTVLGGAAQRSGTVTSLAVQADGKVLVGGWFDAFAGVPRPTLVRLNTNGSVDAGFTIGAGVKDEGTLGVVQVISMTPDAKVLIGGHFETVNGLNRRNIARLTNTGAVDATFDPGAGFADGRVTTMAVLANGAVLVGGEFSEFNGVARAGLARLLISGALDPSFNPGTGPVMAIFGVPQPGQIASLAVRGDGRIVVGGWFSTFNGVARSSLVQLTATGGVDPTFGDQDAFDAEGYRPWVNSVVVQPDGKVVAGGDFDAVGVAARPRLARLTAAGTVDDTFVPGNGGPGAGATVAKVMLQADGKVLVVGDFETFGGAVRAGLARLSAGGALDADYAPAATRGRGFNGEVAAVVVQPDGKVLVGGAFSSFNGAPRRGIARLNADGTLDEGYNPGGGTTSVLDGSPAVTSLVRQPDGKVIIGGWFTEFDGIDRRGVLRLFADGTLDPSFDPGDGVGGSWEGYGRVHSLALQADGKVVVGGWFNAINQVPRNGIARLNADGTLDAEFDPGTGFMSQSREAPVNRVVVGTDAKIWVGGSFDAADGVNRRGIARLLPDGTVDVTFDPGAGVVADQWGSTGTVNSLSLQADGRVLIGGDFLSVNSVARGAIARLNANGSVDSAFGAGGGFTSKAYSPEVLQIVPQVDSTVLVAGQFDGYNGASRRSVARLTATGTLDATFAADLTGQGSVKALAVQPDGKLIVGGTFIGFADAFPTPINVMRLVPKVSPPGAPTGLSATVGDGAVAVGFTPPADQGGAAVTNYEYSLNGAPWQARTPAAPASPLVISGLANGTTYQVRLRAVNSAGPGAASAAVSVTPVAPVASVFVPVPPARVLDTRVGQGGPGPLKAAEAMVFAINATQAGGRPVVPAGAVAIAYNLTVPNPVAAGHVRLMPGDAPSLTSASAINFRANETIANGATVKIDPQRRVKVYSSVPVDVIIDVVGYYVPAAAATGGRFTAVTPVRVYDGRQDPAGALAAGTSRLVSTATTADGRTSVVPAGASAVAYTVSVVRPDGPGHLRVMPGDVESSTSSTINWATRGDVIANGSTVQVDSQRRLRVFNGAIVPVQFLVDVVGYYSAGGAMFYPTDPARVSDSRTAQGGTGPILPGDPGVRVVNVAATQAGGMQVVPSGATAIAYNLTVTATGGYGHLRAYPASGELVTASVLNWPGAGYTRANGSVVGISPSRDVKLYNGAGSPADALVDVLGYYK